jgi:hypothetical protein
MTAPISISSCRLYWAASLREEWIPCSDGDVLIHAGDFSNRMRVEQADAMMADFDKFLGGLPHRHKVRAIVLRRYQCIAFVYRTKSSGVHCQRLLTIHA